MAKPTPLTGKLGNNEEHGGLILGEMQNLYSSSELEKKNHLHMSLFDSSVSMGRGLAQWRHRLRGHSPVGTWRGSSASKYKH